VLGKTLWQIKNWWVMKGKDEGAYVKWLQQRKIVGHGAIEPKDVRRYVRLGELYVHYPKLVFLTGIAWREVAKRPLIVHEYIIDPMFPERLAFWSSANITLQIKPTPKTPVVAGPVFKKDPAKRAPELKMEFEFCNRLEEEDRRQKEEIRLKLAQFADQQKKIDADLSSSSESPMVEEK
jgi:hypothetical protein